jgi:hypothetical protein
MWSKTLWNKLLCTPLSTPAAAGLKPRWRIPATIHFASATSVVPYPLWGFQCSRRYHTWGIGNRKALCQVPIFPYFSTFLGMQCFCCYIMFDPLCSYSFNWIMFLNVMKGLTCRTSVLLCSFPFSFYSLGASQRFAEITSKNPRDL